MNLIKRERIDIDEGPRRSMTRREWDDGTVYLFEWREITQQEWDEAAKKHGSAEVPENSDWGSVAYYAALAKGGAETG